MRFSKSTQQFYPKSRTYASLPDDLINDVRPDDLKTVLNRKPGETIDVVNGRLVIVPVPDKTLEQLKIEKRTIMKTMSRIAIESGIEHDALGALHSYPTTGTDQLNINALVTYSQLKGDIGAPYFFWCADGENNWARRGHSVGQIQAVGIEMADHVRSIQSTYADKLAAIDAATTKAALDLITW